MGNGKDKRDRSRTPKSTTTNSRQGIPSKRDSEQDTRNGLQEPGVIALGPFEMGRNPFNVSNVRDGDIPEVCSDHI